MTIEWADEFLAQVRKRLEIGDVEYGDASHERTPEELVDEIQQELEDVVGWAAILWRRLERIKAKAKQIGV